MSSLKTLFWIVLALCGAMGGCKIFYIKSGTDVIMDCGGKNSDDVVEWSYNNLLIIKVMGKSGTQSKGTHSLSRKVQLIENALKIPSVSASDSGEYKCTSPQTQKTQTLHTLHVVTVSASSSTVLASSEINLSCDIHGNSQAKIQWITPNNQTYKDPGKTITLNPVTTNDAGKWICQITDKEGTVLKKLELDITVVGPLTSPEEVVVPPGGDAELTCSLLNPMGLKITGGGWSCKECKDITFPHLTRHTPDLSWNQSIAPSRVTFKQQKLNTNFTVMLKKVEQADAGTYVCTLKFDNGKNLSTKLILKVKGERASVSGPKNEKMWVWVAIGAASVLLIVLVIVVILIYLRNKHMRRKVRKLKSMRQPLAAKTYCQCNRTERQPRPAGRKERPPPLPSYQYENMN